VKIGVASQNFRTITGHAGKTRRFLLFRTDEQGNSLADGRLDLPKEMSMHEFRGLGHPLDELNVVITAGCGDGFVRKMANRGVEVVQTSETDPLTAVKRLAKGLELPAPEPHQH